MKNQVAIAVLLLVSLQGFGQNMNFRIQNRRLQFQQGSIGFTYASPVNSVGPGLNLDTKTGLLTLTGSAGGGVGFSGNYNDLTNRPTIPTVPSAVSAFGNDAGYLTAAGAQTTFDSRYRRQSVLIDYGTDLANKPILFSGNYNDLINKPTIPTNTNQLTNGAGFATTTDLTNGLAGKQNGITLTTTGSSGAATFNQTTGALNIPAYAGGGSATPLSDNLTTSTPGTAALDARQGSVLKGLVDNNTSINNTQTTQIASFSTTSLTITSGGSQTLTTSVTGPLWVKVRPTSTLTTLALTAPSTLADNQRIVISFGGGSGSVSSGTVVNSFSLVPPAGWTILQATTPSSLQAGETMEYRADASISTLIRIY